MSDKRTHPFNILSLDGGGVRCLIQSIVIRRLEEEFPSFLRDADLLVGTSMGAVQAFYLAAGKKILPDLYTKPKELLGVLQEDFGDLTLGDLNKTVVVIAFDLDNDAENPDAVRWKPKVFHNCFGRDADLNSRGIDVAMYSMGFPSYQGYVDGGVVANNPAMVGLAQGLDPRGPNKNLSEVALFSVGTGKLNNFIEGEKEIWTTEEILNIIFDGGVDLINFQCKQILKERYWRVNPKLGSKTKVEDMQKVAEEEELWEAVHWLQRYWI